MGADRTSVKNVGNRIPEPIQGGRSGWEHPQSAGCLYIGNGTRQNMCWSVKIGRNQRRKMCRDGYKIGRGVSPLLPVLGNLRLKLSCALAALLAKCKQDITRTDNHYTNPKPS